MVNDIPQLREADILVCGGGPAGLGAAIGAARSGVKVLLVERYGCLGGNMTMALVNPFMVSTSSGRPVCRTGRQIIKGVFQEMIERLEKEGAALKGSLFGQSHIAFDAEMLKCILFQMIRENKIELLLHSVISGAIMKDEELKGVLLDGKSGQKRVLAKVVIDATGDGDVAAHAGAPYFKGRKKDGLMQPATLNFNVGGVDLKKNPSREEMDKLFLEEKKSGKLNIPREKFLWFETTRSGEIHVNATRIVGVDGTDVDSLTRAEIEGRRQVFELFKFLKAKVKGFENSFILNSGVQVGIRETRRIKGEYILTAEDVIEGKKFEDKIACGSYPIDIHDPRGRGTKWITLKEGVYYNIPYRSLLPKNVEQLLVAGRPISVDHEAHSSTRVMPTAMVTGQAAGIAAALAVKGKVSPRKVPVKEIQKVLLEQGAYLG